jgi:hypothetical protein
VDASCATGGRAAGVGAAAGAVGGIGELAANERPVFASIGRPDTLAAAIRPDPGAADAGAIAEGFCATAGTATSRPTTSDDPAGDSAAACAATAVSLAFSGASGNPEAFADAVAASGPVLAVVAVFACDVGATAGVAES